ncbi:hypothetical protein DACRYDRAFT_114918 [Dacryopinax primogenitus]|uniref:VPS9 domain-containing protein n=1 Tax=Dacryopinax primogenitus (strain DJM 731) TaxID=1858805 RepID=M5G5P2_DACPD|nr:uncharacterized protein DACRYDRAFT_114918 [Dacryopinax primogenitus]EJU03535.1 hypothetical protein DACRYDRAFT_114918 [Dacryopinax primogenitus]
MSIGRSQGQIISKDSLPAHPLLSPAPSHTSSPSLSPSTTLACASPQPISTSPKYVPYTPRHKPVASTSNTTAPAAALTTNNATGSPTSSATAGGATRELQRQNMKSEIQGLGLSGESAGWGMLDRLSSLGVADDEWEEVWGMITVGKATLLLPKEPLAPGEITADLVRDHVVFLSPPASSSPSPVVTLSGLRGTADSNSLIFRSSLPTDCTQFTNLVAPTSRGPTLAALPPLPLPLSNADLSTPYPTFIVHGPPTPVPLPPRPSPVPPPLPNRPKPAQHPTNRLVSLPFSLFGSKSPTPTPAPPPPVPVPSPPTPPTHLVGEGPTIDVWPIETLLRTREVVHQIGRAVKAEIKLALHGLPGWVTDRVSTFVAPYLPALAQAKKGKLRPSPFSTFTLSNGASNSSSGAGAHASPSPNPSPSPEQQPTPEAFQQFYSSIHQDLQLYFEHAHSPTTSLLGRRSKELDHPAEREEEEREKELDEKASFFHGSTRAAALRDALDRVEAVVCILLFDRLFRPQDSDDDRHDEALASRIAALNMLDLGLEHLGVDVVGRKGEGDKEVEEVVKACGRELQKLPLVQAPREKAAILVTAHKIVADGLAQLPPLRLRPETEVEQELELELGERTARPALLEESGELTARPFPPNPAIHVQLEEQELQEGVNGYPPALHASMEQELEQAQRDTVTSRSSASEGEGQDVFVRTPPVPPLRFPERVGEEESQGQREPPPLPPRHRSASPPPSSISPARSSSPQATAAADLMLPLIIFAVVKSNPAQLVSHLLYVQRYRDSAVGGEENYCLINLSAVVEFLEHVDLGVLGLGGQDKVLSIDELTPIPLVRSPQAQAQAEAVENMGGRLRGTVNQVGELAASTNKVISGVVDSSFSALRGLLSQNQGTMSADPGSPTDELAKIARPGFGLLRRASGFSIASMAASLPGGHGRARSMHGEEDEEGGRPLVEVVGSRANSIREERETDSDGSEEETGTSGQTEEEDEDEEEEEDEEREPGYRSDVRSVRSFSSMMSRESRDRDERRERMSIHDRLANMAAGRFNHPKGASGAGHADPAGRKQQSPPRSRKNSLLSPNAPAGNVHPQPGIDSHSPSPRDQSPAVLPAALPSPPAPLPLPKIHGPSTRFMECSPDDLRLSEIGELLREYRRVVGALKVVGGFEE